MLLIMQEDYLLVAERPIGWFRRAFQGFLRKQRTAALRKAAGEVNLGGRDGLNPRWKKRSQVFLPSSQIPI